MSKSDGAPEQHWRHTVDRLGRPAKLKVGRLLRDFGFSALDDEASDAIEARLAAVGLALEPSLQVANDDDVITIYDSVTEPEATPPATVAVAARDRTRDPDAPEEPDASQRRFGLEAPADGQAGSRSAPIDASDDAEAAATTRRLAQRLSRAREQVQQLQGAVAEQRESNAAAQEQIAAQSARIDEQRDQIEVLEQVLSRSREALAETRDELRRTVDELLALPVDRGTAEPVADRPAANGPAASEADLSSALQRGALQRGALQRGEHEEPSAPDDEPDPDEPFDVEPSLPVPPPPARPRAAKPAPRERPSGRDGKLRGRVARTRSRVWRGACSVCGRVPDEGRQADLQGAGWDVEGESATCPQCRQHGWQLRPGGGAPFRPLSPRQPEP